MQFHILDENYTPVTVMDNELPDAINFNNSCKRVKNDHQVAKPYSV